MVLWYRVFGLYFSGIYIILGVNMGYLFIKRFYIIMINYI